MAFQVVMPRLGWNMEAGSVAAWRKKDGEAVAAGEILFEVESEKAVQEVEALESGVLRIPPGSPPVGTSVPVGTPLAWLLAPGEQMPLGPTAPAAGSAAAPAASPAAAPSAPPAIASPETGRPVAPAPVPVVPSPPAAGRRPAISPRARRVAGELGVDWSGLTGSGSTGRIVERDVRQAAARPGAAPAVARTVPTAQFSAAVPAVLTTEADVTELIRLGSAEGLRAAPSVPSFGDLLVKLAAQAMVRHPGVNVRFDGASVVRPMSVDIGIAVETERGLVAPVVRNAESKRLRQLVAETSGLVERARVGGLAAGELGGAALVLVDLGAFGLDSFTPAASQFDSAVLSAGRVVAKPVVTEAETGRTAVRRMMTLTLAFDARLVDPAPAARFLQAVRRFVEQPLLWLIDA